MEPGQKQPDLVSGKRKKMPCKFQPTQLCCNFGD